MGTANRLRLKRRPASVVNVPKKERKCRSSSIWGFLICPFSIIWSIFTK